LDRPLANNFIDARLIDTQTGAFIDITGLYSNSTTTDEPESLYSNHSYCYFPWLIIQEGLDSTLKKEGETHDADHAKVVRCLGEIGYDMANYGV
jgi:hypothetical protein